MELVKFYRGERSNPSGYSLEDMWAFRHGEFECDHDYVQWLFPSNEPSNMNCDALTLTLEESLIFQKDPELREKVKISFSKMLDFLGFEMVSENGLLSIRPLEPTDKRPEPLKWLTHFNHNMFRVTRILKSLRLMGFGQYAMLFFHALGDYQDKVSENTFQYWRTAVGEEDLWKKTIPSKQTCAATEISSIDLTEKPDFSSLDWLKGKEFTFAEEIGDYNQREYVLIFKCDRELEFEEEITILGDSSDDLKNIILQKDNYYYRLITSSQVRFSELIEKIKPKIKYNGALANLINLYATLAKHMEEMSVLWFNLHPPTDDTTHQV